MKGKKQHCFHLDLSLNYSAPEIAHICEGKTAGYFPSLGSNVDIVDSTRSKGLSRGRKARGTAVHRHAESEFVSSSEA